MWLWLGLWFLVVVVILVVVWVIRPPEATPTPIKLSEPEPPTQLLATRGLEAEIRDRYLKAWGEVQPLFPDDPEIALREIDRLLQNAMRDCGYPTGDFGRVSDEVTEEQLEVLEAYRAGHRISVKGETTMLEEAEITRARAAFQAAFDRLIAAEPSSSSS